MATCKHCNQQISGISHTCPRTGVTYREDASGDFALSMAIGMATNNALLGGLLGGDMAGGILGDAMTPGGIFDSSPSSDCGSGFDSGSSFDSGCSDSSSSF
jgi:hypothetical protein